MKLAFIAYMNAQRKRQARERNKYDLAVMQDVKEGKKMARESTV